MIFLFKMSLSHQKLLFTSVLNRNSLITYNKTNGIGRLEIMSDKRKYEFICVFMGDMHFFKGSFGAVVGKEVFINNITVSTSFVSGFGQFLPEKRYSINIDHGDNKYISFGFYRRYKHREKEDTSITCNFVQFSEGVAEDKTIISIEQI